MPTQIAPRHRHRASLALPPQPLLAFVAIALTVIALLLSAPPSRSPGGEEASPVLTGP